MSDKTTINVEDVLMQLRASGTASLCPPAAATAKIDASRPQLPKLHRDLLVGANGLTVYHGYNRLFGVGCTQCTDMTMWNAIENWKFAWERDLASFLCFAENGWGGQFAYKLEDLERVEPARIYHLSPDTMNATVWYQSFEAFLQFAIVKFAREPYITETEVAFKKFGPLPWGQHVNFAPPILAGGSEDYENSALVPARASMIINGDIYTQTRHLPTPDASPSRLEPYTDEKGRMRMRIIW